MLNDKEKKIINQLSKGQKAFLPLAVFIIIVGVGNYLSIHFTQLKVLQNIENIYRQGLLELEKINVQSEQEKELKKL